MIEELSCEHNTVRCLNEFELIRKYQCADCIGVMMCACDREVGERFLPHQLGQGCVLESQVRLPVTLGFVSQICRECRGLPLESHPKASIPGQTSKIQRYYWREIQFESFKRFAARAESIGQNPGNFFAVDAAVFREEIRREVIAEIKRLHTNSPKYNLKEVSQAEIIAQYQVREIRLDATFVSKAEGRKAGIVEGAEVVSAEEFAQRHYQQLGWSVLFCESRPFHVLFGIYLWTLIQDTADPLGRMGGFGAKMDYPALMITKGEMLWAIKPVDFGTSGYAQRRATAINDHFQKMVPPDREQLLWLFDLSLEGSVLLRDYLWAHDPGDVERAREIVEILPPEVLVRILRYLVGNYWGRYIGWPDLLLYKGAEFRFAEVKASKDTLSAQQKRWIADNAIELRVPFEIVKIHRASTKQT